MSPSETVLVDRRDAVLVVTLNRPHVRNAIDIDVAQRVGAALTTLDRDEDLRVGVLTGAGGCFSSGMDLKAFAAEGTRPHVPERGFAGLVRRPPDKPLVAAIEGYALAGGFEMALACDLIVAARDAQLGIPEVRHGMVAAGGALLRLPHALPRPLAMRLALTGEPMSAERAAALGLVTELADPGHALAQALILAATIAAHPPGPVRAAKQILIQSPNWPADELWERQAAIAEPLMRRPEARAGAEAFVARGNRRPER